VSRSGFAPVSGLPVRFMSCSCGHMDALPHAAGSVPVSALRSRRSSVSIGAQPPCALNSSGSAPLRAPPPAGAVSAGAQSPPAVPGSQAACHVHACGEPAALPHCRCAAAADHGMEAAAGRKRPCTRRPADTPGMGRAARRPAAAGRRCGAARLSGLLDGSRRLGMGRAGARLSRLLERLRYLRLGQAQGAPQPSGCAACGAERIGSDPPTRLPARPTPRCQRCGRGAWAARLSKAAAGGGGRTGQIDGQQARHRAVAAPPAARTGAALSPRPPRACEARRSERAWGAGSGARCAEAGAEQASRTIASCYAAAGGAGRTRSAVCRRSCCRPAAARRAPAWPAASPSLAAAALRAPRTPASHARASSAAPPRHGQPARASPPSTRARHRAAHTSALVRRKGALPRDPPGKAAAWTLHELRRKGASAPRPARRRRAAPARAPDSRFALALSQDSDGRPCAQAAGSGPDSALPSKLTCASRCSPPGAAQPSGSDPPSWLPARFLRARASQDLSVQRGAALAVGSGPERERTGASQGMQRQPRL